MPISVECPACGQKLRAQDNLAGKEAPCPKCGAPIAVPVADTRESRQDLAAQQAELDLLKHLGEDNFEAAAPLLQFMHLWLVNVSSDDSHQPLCAEVDDQPAMVVFTSLEKSQLLANAAPDLLDEQGALPCFSVEGQAVLERMPTDMSLLVNPESEDPLLLDSSCTADLRNCLTQRGEGAPEERASVQIPSPTVEQREAQGDPMAVALRERTMATLTDLGFSPAKWLPLPELQRDLRDHEEIAGRLLSLGVLFAWASAPAEAIPDEDLRDLANANNLLAFMTHEEREVWHLARTQAFDEHSGNIGWKLENMWPLAWVLGFEAQPTIPTSQITDEIIQNIVFDFLGGIRLSVAELLQQSQPRTVDDVIALEDLFYCAHNAVRSAQIDASANTVPSEFDPISDGGVVHERRHSLTWCLSPNTDWNETDLST